MNNQSVTSTVSESERTGLILKGFWFTKKNQLIRVYSHLSCLVRLNQTQVRFPSWCGSAGRCEYSNRTLVRTKQLYRDPAEDVVSVCFQTNSGTVHLRCEYDPTSIRPYCRNHAQKQTACTCSAVVCVSITFKQTTMFKNACKWWVFVNMVHTNVTRLKVKACRKSYHVYVGGK